MKSIVIDFFPVVYHTHHLSPEAKDFVCFASAWFAHIRKKVIGFSTKTTFWSMKYCRRKLVVWGNDCGAEYLTPRFVVGTTITHNVPNVNTQIVILKMMYQN